MGSIENSPAVVLARQLVAIREAVRVAFECLDTLAMQGQADLIRITMQAKTIDALTNGDARIENVVGRCIHQETALDDLRARNGDLAGEVALLTQARMADMEKRRIDDETIARLTRENIALSREQPSAECRAQSAE